jgi:arginine utilization protein RocB
MKNKMSFLTQTIQPGSWTQPDEGKNLYIVKPEDEANMRLMLSIIESLNKLNEKLIRLEYLVYKNNECTIYSGKGKEQQ